MMLVPGVQNLEPEGGGSTTIWRCPNDLDPKLQGPLNS